MIRRPQRSTPLPYSTCFRSPPDGSGGSGGSEGSEPPVTTLPAPVDELPQQGDTPVTSAPQEHAPEQGRATATRSEEHTSELQSRQYLVCRLLLEKKKIQLML